MRFSSIALFNILVLETANNGLSDGFVTLDHIVLQHGLTPTALGFHPQRTEDGDFRTPAASFTFTRYAKAATISPEFVQSKWNEGNDLQRLSYLDIISSTASIANSSDTKNDGVDSEIPEEPLAQAHRIQQAYREWCEFYDKIPNRERLGVFASNFLAVQDFHEKTGRPLVLNEFADLTEEEYRHGSTNDDSNNSMETEQFLTDDRIREAYREWCNYYERAYDEKRLKTFASNFVAVEKYHLHTNESLVLNEFADMTEREYRKHLTTAAHFTTPENIGPRATDDSSPVLQEQKEVKKPDIDPITSYLDPSEKYPTLPSPVEEIQSPIPKSQTSNDNSPSVSSDTSDASNDPSDDSFITNEALSALQNTVSNLSSMVESMAMATQAVAPPPAAQPLDSLVIDVLQQQDGSIAQLEESIEGLHMIQKQSSDLIELVSNNQKQMTDLMEVVQSEVAALQQDQQINEENYALLLQRIEELEAKVAKFDSDDPVLKRSLVLSPAKATKQRRVELKPNISQVGMVSGMFKPSTNFESQYFP